jgi:hypothetical protein
MSTSADDVRALLLRVKRTTFDVAPPDLVSRPNLPAAPKKVEWTKYYERLKEPTPLAPSLFNKKKVEAENQRALAEHKKAEAANWEKFDDERRAFEESHQAEYDKALAAHKKQVADIQGKHKKALWERKKAYDESLASWKKAKAEDLQFLTELIEGGGGDAAEVDSRIASIEARYPDSGEILRTETCPRCQGKGVCAGKAAGGEAKGSTGLSLDAIAKTAREVTCPECGGTGEVFLRGKAASLSDLEQYFNEPCQVTDRILESAKRLAAQAKGEVVFATSQGNEYRTYFPQTSSASNDTWDY